MPNIAHVRSESKPDEARKILLEIFIRIWLSVFDLQGTATHRGFTCIQKISTTFVDVSSFHERPGQLSMIVKCSRSYIKVHVFYGHFGVQI